MQIHPTLDGAQAWAETYADTLRMVYYVHHAGSGWRVTGKKPETGLYYVFPPRSDLPQRGTEEISDDLAERPAEAWE
jgi:hypothetical protein